MLVNISMTFHKDILNGFKVIERTRFVTETATYKAQEGITKTNIQELRFLCPARRPMLVNISLKFQENVVKVLML